MITTFNNVGLLSPYLFANEKWGFSILDSWPGTKGGCKSDCAYCYVKPLTVLRPSYGKRLNAATLAYDWSSSLMILDSIRKAFGVMKLPRYIRVYASGDYHFKHKYVLRELARLYPNQGFVVFSKTFIKEPTLLWDFLADMPLNVKVMLSWDAYNFDADLQCKLSVMPYQIRHCWTGKTPPSGGSIYSVWFPKRKRGPRKFVKEPVACDVDKGWAKGVKYPCLKCGRCYR